MPNEDQKSGVMNPLPEYRQLHVRGPFKERNSAVEFVAMPRLPIDFLFVAGDAGGAA